MSNQEITQIQALKPKLHYGKYRGLVLDNNDPDRIGRLRASVPSLSDFETDWAMPSAPYSGNGAGLFMVPPIGAGVWIEFEAGDVRFPIWTGCWWKEGQLPISSTGATATPSLKIIRTEQGISVALDDAAQTVTIGDGNGHNSIIVQVQSGQIKIAAVSRVVVDAPQIEIVNGGTHPTVFGDDLLRYLSQLVTMLNTHVHLDTGPGVPTSPPLTPLLPPTSTLLSTQVKTG
jgi:hypothetical protein